MSKTNNGNQGFLFNKSCFVYIKVICRNMFFLLVTVNVFYLCCLYFLICFLTKCRKQIMEIKDLFFLQKKFQKVKTKDGNQGFFFKKVDEKFCVEKM